MVESDSTLTPYITLSKPFHKRIKAAREQV